MRSLGKQEMEDIVIGAGLLGSGGGGSTAEGLKLVERVLEFGPEVRLASVDEIPDDHWGAVIAGVGSPKASLTRVRTYSPTWALELLERTRGFKSSFVIPFEVGAGNSLNPMLAAVQKNIPIVNGDPAGRAVPELQMTTFNLEGIPPAPRGIPQVEVAFDIDANGILNVSAKDKATGKQQQITITASTNLNKDEVEQLVQEARRYEGEDRRRKELVEARNTADALIYQMEKTLRDLGDKVSASDRGRIEQSIEELKRAKEGDDTARIRQLIEQLQQASYAIGQQMYAQQQAAGGPQAGAAGFGAGAGPTPGPMPGAGPPPGHGADDVIEGEFQEV